MAKVRRTFKSAKNKALHLYHKCAEEMGCLTPEKRKARRVRAKARPKLKKGFKKFLVGIQQEAKEKNKKTAAKLKKLKKQLA